MRATVIGGGITGLSVGYELAKKGYRVTIFEKEARVGGLAGSLRIGDVWLEHFYHHIFKTDTAILAWIDELGLKDRLIWRPSSIGFFHKGAIHRFTTPLELLKFSPLSFKDRIKLGLAVLHFQHVKNWEALESVTCRDWFSEHVSRAAYETVWEPLLRLKFGDAHDRIPASWIWGRIHPRARSRSKGGMREELGYLLGGFELMIERMKEEIVSLGGEVVEGAQVEYIIQERNTAKGVIARGQELFSDLVVSTVAIPALLKIAPPLPEDYQARLESIRYQAVTCLIMECERSISPVYWLNISDPEMTFGGLIEHTNFVDPGQYGGKRIIYLFNYLSADNPYFRMNAEEYFAAHKASISRINPEFRGEWVKKVHLHRADYGTVIYTLGYRSKMPPFASPLDRLYLVNTSQIYPYDRNMNNCAALGQQFVRSL